MIKLIEKGLFGDKLFEVKTPLMVKRYNSCLKDIGIKPTKLKQFHIDGWGWSPEVADCRKDRFYLSHGAANPYSIIISPAQKNAPIYMPFHSFDQLIHQMIFKQYEDQIDDITAQCGLWFELDKEISTYRQPQDVLMIDYIMINFRTVDRVMRAARAQRSLIRTFNSEATAWRDAELRQAIIKSSKQHGDLRYRKLEMPAIPFADFENYYTQAFEGLFVFRKTKNEIPLLVFEENNSKASGENGHTHIEYNLNDAALIDYLQEQQLVSDSTEWLSQQPVLLEIAKEFLLLNAALTFDADVKFNQLSKTQKKALVNKLDKAGVLPETYIAIEKMLLTLKSGFKNNGFDDFDLKANLLHPHPDLPAAQKAMVWRLLCKLYPNNPVLTYLFNKPLFYAEYSNCHKTQQIWVIEQVLKYKHLYSFLIS